MAELSGFGVVLARIGTDILTGFHRPFVYGRLPERHLSVPAITQTPYT